MNDDFGFVPDEDFGFVPDKPKSTATLPSREDLDRDLTSLTSAEQQRDAAFEAPIGLKETLKSGFENANEEAANSPIGLPSKAIGFVPRLSGKTVQDAMDVLNPSVPLEAPSRPPSDLAQITAGAGNVGRGVGEALVSPLGIATLGAGALPSIGQKAISGAFLADLIRHTPEAAQAAGTASVSGTPQEKTEAYGNLATIPAFAGAIGAHLGQRAALPESPILPEPAVAEAAIKGEQAGLSASVEALKNVKPKETPTNEAIEIESKAEPTSIDNANPEPPLPIQKSQGRVDAGATLADQVAAQSPAEFMQWAREQEGGFTTSAYKLGEQMNTPEGQARLRELEATTKAQQAAKLQEARAGNMAALDEASILASKKQFFTEALESATGVAKNKTNLTAEQVAAAKAGESIAPEPIKAVKPVGAAEARVPKAEATKLESAIEAELGKEGAKGSAHKDWAEINADIEAGMSREQAISKYLDEVQQQRNVIEREDAIRDAEFSTSDQANQAAMTPDQYESQVLKPLYDKLAGEFVPKKRGQKPRSFEDWKSIANNQENIMGDAVHHSAPVNAKAAQEMGLQSQLAEQGYVLVGDLYVKPKQAPSTKAVEPVGVESPGIKPETAGEGIGTLGSEPSPAASPKPKTRLDLMLDGVEKSGKELTIEVTDANRENLNRIISTAEQRGLNASTDGRFVLIRPTAKESPTASSKPAFKKGDKVTTDQYGKGEVTAVLPNRVVVKFDEGDGRPFGVNAKTVKPVESVNEGVLQESGMGGMKPGERLDAPLSAIEKSLRGLNENPKATATEAFDLGTAAAKLKDRVSDTAVGLQAAAKYLQTKLEGKPVWNSWKDVLGGRHLALTESTHNARKFIKTAQKEIPSKLDRAALSNYLDTGGDAAQLAKGASEAPEQYKKGYEAAQHLTPEQKTVANNLREYFEKRLEDAQKAGILEDGIENYLHRTFEKDSDFKKGAISELRSGLFSGKPGLAKQRFYEYDLDAEKAGLKPVKDVIERVARYDLALNKAIADRAAIKAMMEIKEKDGRPMIDVGGGKRIAENEAGEKTATFINRSAKKIDEENLDANRGDYKPFDHPALRKWKWVDKDADGKPIFVQGDVLVHPDAIGRIEKLLGRSRIRANPIGRGALNVSSTIKQTMLDLSGFHQVQIGVHGFEHKAFKPVKEIDFTNPDVRGLVKGGAVLGETSGEQLFNEGLSGSSLTKHIPGIGPRIQQYQHYLFQDYIPRLKTAMGLHALERNQARFPKLSKEELYHLTANQMNAAFGELNYEMMGRSKTMQDALRLTLLAPDFLEARTRFTGQAGTKYGTEQRNALLLGAATMYVTARILNKLIDDEYHFEPKNAFNVVYNGKSYGLRTVQGDLIHAATEPGQFVNHRLNPITTKPLLEFATGRDYFGRKRSTNERLKDIASTGIPISVKGLFSGREQSLLESFLNSFGLVTKRNSPASEVGKLAQEWKEKNKVRNEPGEFIYDAEKDPYRNIKQAADYYDAAAVRSEIAKAEKDGLTKAKIRNHFALSSNSRFTGSAANERKFLESLNADQRDLYNKAKEERKRIKAVVDEALR